MTANDNLLNSWLRSKRAANCSPATITAYANDGRQFMAHLGDVDAASASRGDVESFLEGLLERGLAAATVARRYRSLVQLYRWLDEEEELEGRNPMAKLKAPIVPENPPPVITQAEFDRLLAACEKIRQRPGRNTVRNDRPTFENKRDAALLRMLWTTGVRAMEIMTLTVQAVDLVGDSFTVVAKGRAERIVGLTPQTSLAVDRYIRTRARHPQASRTDALWLGDKGPLTDSGLRQMLDRRTADAELPHINPHKFRHTFAHRSKSKGMTDGDLMAIAGWTTPQMLHRYGKSAAAERARETHRKMFGDE